jgi:hypothetical protein
MEASMHNLRQLPVFLRAVVIVAVLCPLASLGVTLIFVILFIVLLILGEDVARQALIVDSHRWIFIIVNLNMVALACSVAVNGYKALLRQPYRQNLGPFWFDTWPQQARTIAGLAALPLCAMVLAAVIPSISDVSFLGLAALSMLGAFAPILVSLRLGVN